jgi:tRNA A-37 threonylcarbamoyl transferase component Bud32
MESDTCPDKTQLQQLVTGTLPATERIEVEQHLEECGTCQRTVEALSGVTAAWIPPGDAPAAALPVAATGPPSTTERPGILGNYQIAERLDGERGLLLKAFEPRLQRHVAIRLLPAELSGDPLARKRFTRIARTAATIDHDNVVTIHAVEDGGPQPFLVMEFVEGTSLRQWLKQPEKRVFKEVVRLGQQVAAGLAAIHARGLIHGNLGLDSVLVQDRTGRATLTDFGLGLLCGRGAAGVPRGSAEPGKAREEAGGADLAALGRVLFALGTGQEWTEGTDVKRTLSTVPPWLRDTILALLGGAQPSPTAEQTAEILRRQQVALQPAPTRVRRLLTPAERKRRRRRAVAFLLLLALGGLAASELTGATQLVTLATPLVTGQATLVVELEDPDARVTLAGYGIELSEPSTRALSLRPGDYLLRVERPGEPIQEQRVTLPWGGREEVAIRASPPRVYKQPFVVLSRRGIRPQECLTLADAIRAARRNDIIEIHGDGPFKSPPVSIGQHKPLTIRAGTGFRPVIDFEPVEGLGFKSSLTSNGPLVLEGIELRIPGLPTYEPKNYHVVARVTGAPFHVAHCRILVNGAGYGLMTAEAPAFVVRNSELIHGNNGAGALLSAGNLPTAARVEIDNCILGGGERGLDFSRKSLDVRDVALRLRGNTLSLGRTLLLVHWQRDLPTDKGGKEPPISIEMTGNVIDARLQFLRVLFNAYKADEKSLTAAQGEAALLCLARCQMRDNLLPEGIGLLRFVQGWDTPLPGSVERHTLKEWYQFWRLPADNSLQDRPIFVNADLADRLIKKATEVMAADFLLVPDTPGKGGPWKLNVGADPDRIGPGPAYERWKKTKEYREWVKTTGQLP